MSAITTGEVHRRDNRMAKMQLANGGGGLQDLAAGGQDRHNA